MCLHFTESNCLLLVEKGVVPPLIALAKVEEHKEVFLFLPIM